MKHYILFCNKNELKSPWDAYRHGSLEAILGSTKMTWKTKTGDGCGVMSGVQNNGFWNPARYYSTQHISKTKFCKQILQKSRFGPGKRLCKNLKMALRVGKFNIDNFRSLELFISSILSLAILIFLNKVLHTVLLHGYFLKQLIRPNLLR